MARNWTCPYYNRPQTVTASNFDHGEIVFSTVLSNNGHLALLANCTICANPECHKASVSAEILAVTVYNNGHHQFSDPPKTFFRQRLMPNSSAKPQPVCIPSALVEDYSEACLIRDLSPKASATLSRRCLQGMIRDFCGVKDSSLNKEIQSVRSLVETGGAPQGVSIESIDAIDHVRGVGNIGAHMEKDINHIVPVEPEEAQLLIDLIESLFEEWYVAREKRTIRFGGVKALAESKKALIDQLRTPFIEASRCGD